MVVFIACRAAFSRSTNGMQEKKQVAAQKTQLQEQRAEKVPRSPHLTSNIQFHFPPIQIIYASPYEMLGGNSMPSALCVCVCVMI